MAQVSWASNLVNTSLDVGRATPGVAICKERRKYALISLWSGDVCCHCSTKNNYAIKTTDNTIRNYNTDNIKNADDNKFVTWGHQLIDHKVVNYLIVVYHSQPQMVVHHLVLWLLFTHWWVCLFVCVVRWSDCTVLRCNRGSLRGGCDLDSVIVKNCHFNLLTILSA